MKYILTFIWLLCLCAPAETVNVFNYGATGDCQQVWSRTIAGSTKVTITNGVTAADVGKTIELFGCGPTNIAVGVTGGIETSNQDYIGLIVSTNGDGTNVTVSDDTVYNPATGGTMAVPPQVTMNACYCIYGTNNAVPFANACASASSNAVIYIPHGTVSTWGVTNGYLLMPLQSYGNFSLSSVSGGYNQFLTNAALVLRRGGLTFSGDGEGQSILMAQGAWKAQGQSNNFYAGMRGAIVECLEQILTNNYPVVFSNLTFDGGVPIGLNDSHQNYQPASPIDGLGWDNNHHAELCALYDTEPGWNNVTNVNCEFRHWRGEMLIDATGTATTEYENCTNCIFWDGEGTACNLEIASAIGHNIFYDLYQVEEQYQKYITNSAGNFLNNFCTNVAHNFVTVNGGTSTNLLYTISGNVFSDTGPNCVLFGGGSINGMQFNACNISFSNNACLSSNFPIWIVTGVLGGQEYFDSSNIQIVCNSFGLSDIIISLTSANAHPTDNVLVSNNILTTAAFVSGAPTVNALKSSGPYTNVTFVTNNFYPSAGVGNFVLWSSGNNNQQYVLILTNTVYPNSLTPAANTTNILTYGGGPWYQAYFLSGPGNAFVISDSDASQIPAGAMMVIDDTVTSGTANGIFTIFENSIKTRSLVTAAGNLYPFWWYNSQWNTNAPNGVVTKPISPWFIKKNKKQTRLIGIGMANN